MDVKVKKNVVMKGQAFVVFKEEGVLDKILESQIQFKVNNKEIVLERAKSESDLILMSSGQQIPQRNKLITKDFFNL